MTLDVDNARRWLVENHPHEECRHLAELLHDYSLSVQPCNHDDGKAWLRGRNSPYEICGHCLLSRKIVYSHADKVLDKIQDVLRQN